MRSVPTWHQTVRKFNFTFSQVYGKSRVAVGIGDSMYFQLDEFCTYFMHANDCIWQLHCNACRGLYTDESNPRAVANVGWLPAIVRQTLGLIQPCTTPYVAKMIYVWSRFVKVLESQ